MQLLRPGFKPSLKTAAKHHSQYDKVERTGRKYYNKRYSYHTTAVAYIFHLRQLYTLSQMSSAKCTSKGMLRLAHDKRKKKKALERPMLQNILLAFLKKKVAELNPHYQNIKFYAQIDK